MRNDAAYLQLLERTFTAKQRKALAKSGAAMPDGSYPIENIGDLDNAVRSYGRSPDPATKAHIIKRAKELKATNMLPAGWPGSTKKESAAAAGGATTEARVQGSTDTTLDAIRSQFRELYPDKQGPMGGYDPGPWVKDVFLDDGYLVCNDDGVFWKVEFTVDADGQYQFALPGDWKEVYLTYADADGGDNADESRRQNWTEAPAKHTRIVSELADLREAKVDTADGVTTVRNVTLIKPGFSTNADKAGRPRYYPAATLKAAASQFEGVRAYVNHPSKSQATDLPERSILDIAGYWTTVHASDSGALVGDLRLVGRAGQDVQPLISEAVANKPGLVDVSINALGTTRMGEAEGRKAVIVESIVGANSVDIVTTGAAGGTFAGALLASDGGMTLTRQLLGALSFDEWKAARPDLVGKLKAEWKTVRESDALKEAKAQAGRLQTKLAEAETQHRAALTELAGYRRGETADRLLAGSLLPHTLRQAVRGQLLEAKDEAAMQAVLEREQAKWRAAPRQPVEVTGAGQRPSAPAHTEGAKPAPAANLLAIPESVRVLPGESVEQYRARRLREQAGTTQ